MVSSVTLDSGSVGGRTASIRDMRTAHCVSLKKSPEGGSGRPGHLGAAVLSDDAVIVATVWNVAYLVTKLKTILSRNKEWVCVTLGEENTKREAGKNGVCGGGNMRYLVYELVHSRQWMYDHY